MTAPETFAEQYLAVFGALQALIIQQDAFRNLHDLFIEPKLPKRFMAQNTAWVQLRSLRVSVAGHPSSRGNTIGIISLKREDWGVHTSTGDGIYIQPFIVSLLPQYELELLKILVTIDDGIEAWMDQQAKEHTWLVDHIAQKRANR
jgi:hypothetical protein